MSRNAIVRALESTQTAGISPATMLQKRQSATSPILTCDGLTGRPTYMVALLRTLGASPLWCTAWPRYWPSVLLGDFFPVIAVVRS